MAFTLVFEGNILDLEKNPFKIETPFGRPIAMCTGDALEKLSKIHEVMDGEPNKVFIPPHDDRGTKDHL